MKHLLLLTLVALLGLASCKKEDQPECEVNQTLTVSFTNTSNNPYIVAYKGGSFILSANSTIAKYDVAANGTNISWTQQSGFLVFPTTGSTYLNDRPCTTYSVTLP